MIVRVRYSQILPQEKRDHMTDLGAVLEQLKQERTKLDRAIVALSGVVNSVRSSTNGGSRKGMLSVAARKRIAAAQRARWAKARAKK
jgi:hypothetical protein